MFFLILRLLVVCFIYYWGIRGINWWFKKQQDDYYKRTGFKDGDITLDKIKGILWLSGMALLIIILNVGTYFSLF